MNSRMISRSLRLAFFVSAVLWPSGVFAGTFTIVHSFTGGADGGPSYIGLIPDAAGNLYGSTVWGGSTNCQNGCGVIYQLSPASGGSYTQTVLYPFQGGSDGFEPAGNLVLDASGNLWGTTIGGGTGGLGTVFELTPTSSGWSKTLIYSFPKSGAGGGYPISIVFDASGNIFGNAAYNGAHNNGVIYELTPGSSGWTEKILHTFSGGNDGALPYGSIMMDSAGNIYGAAINGGSHSDGVIYELEPQASGLWKEVVLHSFTGGADGADPGAGVTMDASGNLYGTTIYGGNTTSSTCTKIGPGCGVAFKLIPTSTGWHEGVIHTFTGGNDGSLPQSLLTFDSLGNAYGAAAYGGNVSTCPFTIGCGTIFKLTPGSHGAWSASALHRFSNKADGSAPNGYLYIDGSGNLFGTASAGASTACTPTGGCGTIFEITAATAKARN